MESLLRIVKASFTLLNISNVLNFIVIYAMHIIRQVIIHLLTVHSFYYKLI